MLISKKWLQSYFTSELPSMKKIADILLLHSFEIEGMEEVNNDWVLDIDVLPNRAHDCLCHDGIAKEVAGLLCLELKGQRFSNVCDLKTTDENISIKIENKNKCKRYIGTLVKNIEVRESPEWLKNRLISMGQKSINNLVDATNFIMFDLGQPMHVFDADIVKGGIIIRNSKKGEKMVTLSGEEIELLETDLVITDEEKILALAGVKGGNIAEVTSSTKNIIIESANFDPLTIRKTARRVKILTDASKRYENEITSEKAMFASRAMLSLVIELANTDNTCVGVLESGAMVTDIYPDPEEQFILEFTRKHTAQLLGFDISEKDINTILEKFQYFYVVENGNYKISVPFERLDLRIPEDIIEEIGRLYGYHNIPIVSVRDLEFNPEINKKFYVSQRLRNYFIEESFTEIMNYTFVNKGNIELLNPIASDKKALRKNLSTQMKESIEKNARVADFVNVDQILNFEIDNVHTKEGEKTFCCFGIETLSKKSRKKYGDENKQIEKHVKAINNLFNVKELDLVRDGNIISFDISQFDGDFSSYEDILEKITFEKDDKFVGISIYPYVKRDISFWIDTIDVNILEKVFWEAEAEYLMKIFIFDEFEKDGRTSYAFSLIFQSDKKTLTDQEVMEDMKKINKAIENLDGEIR